MSAGATPPIRSAADRLLQQRRDQGLPDHVADVSAARALAAMLNAATTSTSEAA